MINYRALLKLKTGALFVCGGATVITCSCLWAPGAPPEVISIYYKQALRACLLAVHNVACTNIFGQKVLNL